MHLTADHYNALRPGMVGSVESHDDPRPTSADAQRARVIAIREGRLRSVPRDEVVPLPPEVAPVAVTEPAPIMLKVAGAPEEIERVRAALRVDPGSPIQVIEPNAPELIETDDLGIAVAPNARGSDSVGAAVVPEAPAPTGGTDAPEIQVAPTAPEPAEPKGSESPDGR